MLNSIFKGSRLTLNLSINSIPLWLKEGTPTTLSSYILTYKIRKTRKNNFRTTLHPGTKKQFPGTTENSVPHLPRGFRKHGEHHYDYRMHLAAYCQ